jgi:hypothetical protein
MFSLKNIFSVKTEGYTNTNNLYFSNYHKVLTIFGIKFKFKTSKTRERTLKRIFNEQHRKTTPWAYLPGVQVSIAQHCNLNCQCCWHFSPLADEEFASLETFEKDIKRLAELSFGEIDRIQLMGGEPLLHPECIKFAEITRKYFDKTDVVVVTNGILLLQQDEGFFFSCAKNDIKLEATKYPIKIDWDAIKEKCNKYNIKFEFVYGQQEVKTSGIYPIDLEGKQDPFNSFINCKDSNGCITLHEGKLYTCGVAAHMRHFNKYFNKNIPISPNNSIDIYDAKNMNEILMFLAKPIPVCKYCNLGKRIYNLKWRTSKKQIEEWGVQNAVRV